MKYYTAEEVARLLGVNKYTVWRWGREQKIRKLQIGRTVRFALEPITEQKTSNSI